MSLVKRSRANAQALAETIQSEVKNQLAVLEVVTRDAVERLEQQVASLSAQVEALARRRVQPRPRLAARPWASRRRRQEGRRPRRRRPRRRSPKKAAAKKAPAKKAGPGGRPLPTTTS